MFDIKTMILITAGLLTIATMIYCIIREVSPSPKKSNLEIIDDQLSESNYDTMDGEESVFESQ